MATWEVHSTHAQFYQQEQYDRDPAPMSDDEESDTSFVEVKQRRKVTRGKKRSSAAPKVVEVVECPSAFPYHKQYQDSKRGTNQGSTSKRVKIHDTSASTSPTGDVKEVKDENFFDVYKEVRDFGAQGFTGSAKQKHKKDLYKQITGRDKKGEKMPVKLYIEVQRKRAEREKRDQEDARVSGLVSGSSSSSAIAKKRKREERDKKRITEKRRSVSLYGPAPSIGFMKGGLYRMKK